MFYGRLARHGDSVDRLVSKRKSRSNLEAGLATSSEEGRLPLN
ncbi:hypothetical protein [Paraburkholderia sp. HD33-4]|nr:hypothetical protein [Paraburkholderia sp. HD33-4]